MHTGARVRKQKYTSIYISLHMKTFLKTGAPVFLHVRSCAPYLSRFLENAIFAIPT